MWMKILILAAIIVALPNLPTGGFPGSILTAFLILVFGFFFSVVSSWTWSKVQRPEHLCEGSRTHATQCGGWPHPFRNSPRAAIVASTIISSRPKMNWCISVVTGSLWGFLFNDERFMSDSIPRQRLIVCADCSL